VIVVGMRITISATSTTVATVLRRTAGWVQYVGGRIEVRVKAETGKVFLKQSVGRGWVQMNFLPGVLDQVWELDGRVQQRSCDRYGIDGCHGRLLLLLVVMLLVVLLMVLLLLVMGVVVVVKRVSNGAGCVWLEQSTDAKRLRVLGGYRRIAGSHLHHRYDWL